MTPRPLHLSSFPSINGPTFVVSDHYCVLGYFEDEAEAKRFLKAEKAKRKARASRRR